MLEKFSKSYVLEMKMEKTIYRDKFDDDDLEFIGLVDVDIDKVTMIVNDNTDFKHELFEFVKDNVNTYSQLSDNDFIIVDNKVVLYNLEDDDCMGVSGDIKDYEQGEVYSCTYEIYFTINGIKLDFDDLREMFKEF